MMPSSYFWPSCCLQNDTLRSTNFPGISSNGEKPFLCFSSPNTVLLLGGRKTKQAPPTLLGIFTPSGFHICSLQGMADAKCSFAFFAFVISHLHWWSQCDFHGAEEGEI